MAVPANPTVEEIILDGMREAGRYSVTSSQAAYTEFKNFQWATVKTEIWNACRTDRLLESTVVRTVAPGTYYITEPDDFDNEIKLIIFDGSEDYRGTAQAGTSSTITLAASFSANEDDLLGSWIFTLTGTGAQAGRTITDYDDTTKIVTVDSTWPLQNPDNTTTYLIAQIQRELKRDDYILPFGSRRPEFYSRRGTQIEVYPTADQYYPIWMFYRPNLTQLDETNPVFIKHLRERRLLWVQGVKVRTMARYDDERYPLEKQIWEQMLRQYGGHNAVYTRMAPNR